MSAVFCDSSVLVRYFAEDDIPRALAAARLIDGDSQLKVSTGVVLESIHVLRGEYSFDNPRLADLLIRFLGKSNVHLVDADKSALLGALAWSQHGSSRRISDAVIVHAAEQARVDYIATFDAAMRAPAIQVRML